jgi:Flp pilus assembly protein TadD
VEQPVTLTRELTLEEAVSFAIFLQQNQQFVEAHELYRRVLEASPDHPRALHYAGVLAHQQGKISEAIELIQRSLTFVADEADWHSNLGIVFQSDGKLDHAIDAYRRAIAIDPGHANAHNNLGVLLRATGQPVEAEAAYRAAIRLNSEHIDAYTNLGILLNGLKRPKEAVACYCKVVTLRPKHREARKQLALAHCTLGDVAEAVKIFEEWLQEEPGDPIAQHMLAACTGRGVPKRASNSFVETTFDSFASSFESKLEKLSYRAPALVAAMLENSGLEPLNRLDPDGFRRTLEQNRRELEKIGARAVTGYRARQARARDFVWFQIDDLNGLFDGLQTHQRRAIATNRLMGARQRRWQPEFPQDLPGRGGVRVHQFQRRRRNRGQTAQGINRHREKRDRPRS